MHKWTRFSFFAHTILAFGVIMQLITSQIWNGPQHPKWFLAHEISGITVFVFAILLFLSKFFSRDKAWQNWYPVTAEGWRKVTADIRYLRQFKLPDHTAGGLAGVVQGLGLLLIMLMGLLAVSWLLIKTFAPHYNAIGSDLIHTHSFFATFVWIYICGHGFMAILHQWLPPRFKVQLP